jgi:hypothetical protein
MRDQVRDGRRPNLSRMTRSGRIVLSVAVLLAVLATSGIAGAGPPPLGNGSARFDELTTLNNKLGRALAHLDGLGQGGIDSDHERRVLKDLEVTKLRAAAEFPSVLGLPYTESFTQLSCIDEEISKARLVLDQFEETKRLKLFGTTHISRFFAHAFLIAALRNAKACKDALEVALMHSFDLTTSAQNGTDVAPTTPMGADTQNPSKLNAPKTLEHAYRADGFIGRHEQDYVAAGVRGSSPESWPAGRNVLFFDVFDLFASSRGAHEADVASENNLKASGFSQIGDSSFAPGEAVFQHRASGSTLLSTIIYVQRGTFIMKIAGACNGCVAGSIESSLKSFAAVQLGQAVQMGFPAGSSAGAAPEQFETSGNAPQDAFGQPGYHLCLYLHGPAGQTGDVTVQPGDATSQTDPNAKTYNQSFTLDGNGTAFLSFTEPAELFKITIDRRETDGSGHATTTSADPRIHNPPPWGLPACT